MPTPEAVREQVKKIRETIRDQKGELLHYIVEEFLAGHQLTEFSIGVGFFGFAEDRMKPEIGDGEKDKRPSNVRVTKGKLRDQLEDYYRNKGLNDFVHIELPERGYTPIITARFDDLSSAAKVKLRRSGEAREKRSASGYADSIRLLGEILVEHPDHPEVLGRLAEIHSMRVIHSIVPPRPELELARQYAEAALSKSSSVWPAYVALGGVHVCLEWNWRGAEESFLKAERIGGRHVRTLPWFFTLYSARGRGEELIEFLKDYISNVGDAGPLLRRNLGTALMLGGHFEEAIMEFESAFPQYLAHLYMVMIYYARGEFDKALEQAQIGNAGADSRFRGPGLLILALARAGRKEEAQERLAALQTRQEYAGNFELAVAYLGLGETDRVLDYLERAADEREYLMLFLPFWPLFIELHRHPRFLSIVKRMGLPEPRQ